jgi:phage shock protein C
MTETTSSTTDNATTATPLRRPINDRMLAGVAVGLADYLGIDVTLVRIALAVLAVMGGAGVPLYLAGWLLIPEEGSTQSIASEFLSRWPHPQSQ